MAKQFGNVWVSRDDNGESPYNISKGRPTNAEIDCVTYAGVEMVIIPSRFFHRLFPNIRLSRGGGPMRAKISIEI